MYIFSVQWIAKNKTWSLSSRGSYYPPGGWPAPETIGTKLYPLSSAHTWDTFEDLTFTCLSSCLAPANLSALTPTILSLFYPPHFLLLECPPPPLSAYLILLKSSAQMIPAPQSLLQSPARVGQTEGRSLVGGLISRDWWIRTGKPENWEHYRENTPQENYKIL